MELSTGVLDVTPAAAGEGVEDADHRPLDDVQGVIGAAPGGIDDVPRPGVAVT
jgi:hypothetical protein